MAAFTPRDKIRTPTRSGLTIPPPPPKRSTPPDEAAYLKYVRYLSNDENKWEIFSRLYPDHTCPGILFRLETLTAKSPLVFPNQVLLTQCIDQKQRAQKALALNFVWSNHANLIWIDPATRTIERYDPYHAGTELTQERIDATLSLYWERILPGYLYLGNTLEATQIEEDDDRSSQDYVLVYALNRIQGKSHEEALANTINLTDAADDLLRDLIRHLRSSRSGRS